MGGQTVPPTDETGNVYGRLRVLDRAPSRRGADGARWRCRCECGAETEVYGYTLRAGKSKSCGRFECAGRVAPKRLVDETGNRYGCLVVTGREGGLWKVRCDCGGEDAVVSRALRRRYGRKDCGCGAAAAGRVATRHEMTEARRASIAAASTASAEARRIELVGRRYGKLTVVSRDATARSRRESWWSCKCDCGGITSVRRDALVRGATTSCGCVARAARERARLAGLAAIAEARARRAAEEAAKPKQRFVPRYGSRFTMPNAGAATMMEDVNDLPDW